MAASDHHGRGFVRWQDASTVTVDGQSTLKSDPRQVELGSDLPPIIKRTPQQRVESLTRRLLDHMEDSFKAFGEPRIPQELLDEIKTEYWKAGRGDEAHNVNIETVRAIAAKFLQEAEMKEKHGKKNPNRSR